MPCQFFTIKSICLRKQTCHFSGVLQKKHISQLRKEVNLSTRFVPNLHPKIIPNPYFQPNLPKIHQHSPNNTGPKTSYQGPVLPPWEPRQPGLSDPMIQQLEAGPTELAQLPTGQRHQPGARRGLGDAWEETTWNAISCFWEAPNKRNKNGCYEFWQKDKYIIILFVLLRILNHL